MDKQKKVKKQKKNPHDVFFEASMKYKEVARSLFEAHLEKEVINMLNLDSLVLVDSLEGQKIPYGSITYQCYDKDSETLVFIHAMHGNPIKEPYMIECMKKHEAYLKTSYLKVNDNQLPTVFNLVINSGN